MPTVDSRGSNAKGSLVVAAAAAAAEQPKGTRHSKRACHTHNHTHNVTHTHKSYSAETSTRTTHGREKNILYICIYI